MHGHQKNKSTKEVGDEYFHDLLSRPFFQRYTSNNACLIMHDLVSDLAKQVSGEFSFTLEVEEARTISKKTGHFSYMIKIHEASRRFEIIHKADRLRRFLPLYLRYEGDRLLLYIPRMVVENLLSRCKSLRVLSLLGYCNIFGLPEVTWTYTAAKRLPNSTCLLSNLQTFMVLRLFGSVTL